MRTIRIYQNQPLVVGKTLQLDEGGVRHVVNVLRLKPDSELVLFNGDGHDYIGRLLDTSKKHATVQIEACQKIDRESTLHTHLALGIAKGERMDYAMQKAVELGVSRLTPLLSERCVVQLDTEREIKRLQHWQGVIQSASEQSGRTILPQLDPIMRFDNFLDEPADGQRMILDPGSTMHLSQCDRPQQLILMIGPEGGFTSSERDLAYQQGAVGIQLGPRILRTETAVVAGLTAVQTLWGDLDRPTE
jgi:16S rRNA (uracil1498-N3)-methyltransferase